MTGPGARSSRWLRSGRARGAAVALVVLVGVTVLAVSGFQDTLVYYRTPSEVVQSPPAGDERFRVGGMVVPGSLQTDGGQVRFVLTDGARDLPVRAAGNLPQTFREGQGAVVEGTVASGVFRADRVIVRHSNEYRPPEQAAAG